MAMVIDINKKRCCASCKWCQGNFVKSYDARTGRMTVDNSGCSCAALNKRILPTANACAKYERSYQY